MTGQPGSVKKCPFCVATIPDTAAKCEKCGADLNPEGWTDSHPGVYPQPVWQVVALSLATFGLYYFYWYYKSWRQVSQYTGKKMSPGWRTVGLLVPILGLVFTYDLFDDVQQMLTMRGMRPTIRAGWLLVMLIAFGSCWRFPGSVGYLGLLAVVPIAIVQSDMNRLLVSASSGALAPRRLSGIEIAVLVIGSILVMLALVGTLIPE